MYDNTDSVIDSNTGIVLKNITAGNSLKLKVEGKGKAAAEIGAEGGSGDAAINDAFKLKLKFKKKGEI